MSKRQYFDYEDDESVLPIGCDRRWHRLDQKISAQQERIKRKHYGYGRTEKS